MSNFENQPSKELKEIADMRRGRDLTALREKMIKETEEGVEALLRADEEKKQAKEGGK